MADCNKCLYMPVCKDKTNAMIRSIAYDEDIDIECNNFKDESDYVKVVRCMDCKHSRSLNKMKSPEKYYKDSCIVCECEDVVGDEPAIYPRIHFCSYGERKDA